MSSVQIVDRNEGLPPEEVAKRLSTGWLCVSDVAVDTPSIAVPGQPQKSNTIDIWLAPPYGSMMPQLATVQALLVAEDNGDDVITLDNLSKTLFQQSLRQLRKAVTQAPEGEPQEEESAQSTPQANAT